MTADDPSRSPVDQALDLFVYLPIGFMLELPRSIPRFIERGRREFHSLPPAARGDIADTVRQFERLQAHAHGTLRALGVVPPSRTATDEGRAATVTPLPTAPGARSGSESARREPARRAAPDSPSSRAPVQAADGADLDEEPGANGEDTIDPGELAIPGYDSLSASQVVPRLESLSTEELELVRRYELDNRGRKTILNKVAQIQAR